MARLVISLPRFGIRVDELSSTRVTGPPPQLSAGTEPSFRFPWWSATWRWGSPRKSASLRPSLSSPVRFQREGCKGCKWCKLTCSCLHWETMVDTHGRSQWMHSWPVPKWDRYTEKPILDHRREYHFLPFQRQVSCPWTRSQAGHLPRNLRSWGALTRTFKRISMKTNSIKWKVEKFHGTNIFSASGYIHNHHLQSGSSSASFCIQSWGQARTAVALNSGSSGRRRKRWEKKMWLTLQSNIPTISFFVRELRFWFNPWQLAKFPCVCNFKNVFRILDTYSTLFWSCKLQHVKQSSSQAAFQRSWPLPAQTWSHNLLLRRAHFTLQLRRHNILRFACGSVWIA